MKWATLIGIALWAIIPCVIANKKGRAGIAYFFLSFLITPLLTTIITLCLKPLDEINAATDFLPEHGSGGFTSKAESEYVHNAIANGSTFDDALAEWKRLHESVQVSESQESIRAVEPEVNRMIGSNIISSEIEQDTVVTSNESSEEKEKLHPSAIASTFSIEEKQGEENICPNCGCVIPEDSEFCQYCGTTIVSRQETEAKTISSAVSTVIPRVVVPAEKLHEKANVTFTDAPEKKQEQCTVEPKERKVRFCKKCGGTIDKDTRKCSSCGKQYFRPKSAIPIIVLSVVVLAFVGLNVWQFFLGRQAAETISDLNDEVSALNSTVSSLNSDIAEKDSTISAQQRTINSQKNSIASLENDNSDLRMKNLRQLLDLSFYEEHAVVVPDDGTYTYHKYGCDDLDTSSFWIYNTEAAKSYGYKACPKCIG